MERKEHIQVPEVRHATIGHALVCHAIVRHAIAGKAVFRLAVACFLAHAVFLCLPARVNASELFNRGDANQDDRVDIADSVSVLISIFLEPAPLPCADAGDANDDGTINIADASYGLSFLFQKGPAPPAPYFPTPCPGRRSDARPARLRQRSPRGS